MTFCRMRSAFTLLELLTVVTIIALIASLGLVTLRDTGEIRAKQYSTELLRAVKKGVASSEDSRTFTGFVNDFGTMPPKVGFLLNREESVLFMNDTLGRYRIVNLLRRATVEDGVVLPFLDEVEGADFIDSTLGLSVEETKRYSTPALYIGYHGGYIGEGVVSDDGTIPLKDGWGLEIKSVVDLNISKQISRSFFRVISAGSDQRFTGDEPSYLKEEFDAYRNEKHLKGLYASDLNISYCEDDFKPSEMLIDVDTDTNHTRVVLYAPMLYFAQGSSDVRCSESNTTHADCDGTASRYIPYIPHVEAFDATVVDKNMSWHVGAIKYLFDLNTTEGNLSINNQPYIFAGSDSASLKGSAFFESVRVNGGLLWTGSGDESNPFYLTAGEKIVVILSSSDGGVTWEYKDAYTAHFMPGKKIEIIYPR